ANLVRAAHFLRRHPVSSRQGVSFDGPTNDSERERALQPMEKALIRQRLPNTDSVEELASFWDSHDLTDFEEDLEEVAEPVFVRARGTSLSVDLQPAEAQHLRKIARSKGVKETSIVRQWILEGLHQFQSTGRAPNKALQRTAQKARRR